MAQNTRREVELALSVTTANADALGKLREDVKDLAKSGGDAAPELKALADELGKLEQQARQLAVIDSFAADLQKASDAQQAAAGTAGQYKAALDAAQGTLEKARAAEKEKNAEIAKSAGELKTLEAAYLTLKSTLGGTTNATDDYRKKASEARSAINEKKAEIKTLQAELIGLKGTTEKAEDAQKKANTAYKESATALKEADKAINGLQSGVDAANRKLIEAGGQSIKLGDAQGKLAADVTQAKNAIQAQITALDELERAEREAATQAELFAATQAQTLKRLGDQAKAEADGIIRDYQRMEQAQREAAAAAQAAGQRIQDAFSDVGTKSVAGLREQINRVRESMQLLASSGAATGRELDQAMRAGQARINELEREIREATGSLTLMDKAAGALKTTIGQLAAFVSLVEVVERTGRAFLDANANIERMRLGLTSVLGDAGTAERQIAFLQQTADRAGVAFNDISDSFLKFSASAKLSNIPLEQSNELFNELTRVGGLLGLSADRVNRSLEALGQIAAKGVVNMEELRQQLGDNFPGALALTAKGLGVTTAELFKMVEAGEVTAAEFFPAFTKSLSEIEGQSNTLTAAWQRLNNAVTVLFQKLGDSGVTDALKTALNGLTSAVKVLGDNMTVLTGTAEALFKVFLAAKFASIVQGFFGLGQATQKVTVDTVAATGATTALSGATTANTAAVNTNTAAKTANAAATTALAGANTAAAASTGRFAGLLGGLNTDINNVGKAAEDTAKKKGLLGTAMDLGGTAARGFMGLLGGPVGLIALTALYAKDIGELAAKFVLWATGQDNLEESTRKIAKAEEEARLATEARNKELERQQIAAEKARAAQLGLTDSGIALVKNLEELKAKGELTNEEIQKIGKDFDLSTNIGIEEAVRVLGALKDEGVITSEQFRLAWAEALDGEDIATFESKFRAAMGQNVLEAQIAADALKAATAAGLDPVLLEEFAQRFSTTMGATVAVFRDAANEWRIAQENFLLTRAELEEYRLRFEGAFAALQKKAKETMDSVKRDTQTATDVLDQTLRASIVKAGLDFDLITKGVSKAAKESIDNVDLIIRRLGELQEQGADVGRVLQASLKKALDTADSQKAIDELTKRIEGLRSVLGDKVTDGLLKQASEQADELAKKLDGVTRGVQTVAEAFKLFGIKTKEELQQTAAESERAFRLIQGAGTNSADVVRTAFKKYAEDAIAANGGVASSLIKVEAQSLGLRIAVDKDGKAIVQTMQEAAEATNKVGDAAKDAADEFRKLGNEAETAAQKIARGVIPANSWRGDWTPEAGDAVSRANFSVGTVDGSAQRRMDREAEARKKEQTYSTLPYIGGAGWTSKEIAAIESGEDPAVVLARRSGGTAPTTTNTSSSGTTVNINLNGSSTRINVASQSDANALQSLLQQLANQSTRALI